MPTMKLVMVQCLDAQKEIREILKNQDVPEFILDMLIEKFDGALVPIPGQPDDAFFNSLDKGHAWAKVNGKAKGMKDGDLYRAIVLKGGVGRFNSSVKKVNKRDINTVFDVPFNSGDYG